MHLNAPPLRLTVEDRDRHRWASLIAVALLAAAIVMAVFGLPAVDLHGPLHRIGIMDPLCGGTRAARYTAQGHLGLAWRYNPLGIVTVIVGALLVARTAAGIATHRWITPHITWTRRGRRIVVVLGIALLAVLEIRQQGRADLLMTGTPTVVDHPFTWSNLLDR